MNYFFFIQYADKVNKAMESLVQSNVSGNGRGPTKSAPGSLSSSQFSLVQQINEGYVQQQLRT